MMCEYVIVGSGTTFLIFYRQSDNSLIEKINSRLIDNENSC